MQALVDPVKAIRNLRITVTSRRANDGSYEVTLNGKLEGEDRYVDINRFCKGIVLRVGEENNEVVLMFLDRV